MSTLLLVSLAHVLPIAVVQLADFGSDIMVVSEFISTGWSERSKLPDTLVYDNASYCAYSASQNVSLGDYGSGAYEVEWRYERCDGVPFCWASPCWSSFSPSTRELFLAWCVLLGCIPLLAIVSFGIWCGWASVRRSVTVVSGAP